MNEEVCQDCGRNWECCLCAARLAEAREIERENEDARRNSVWKIATQVTKFLNLASKELSSLSKSEDVAKLLEDLDDLKKRVGSLN